LGGSAFDKIFTDEDGQLTCTTTCPPQAVDSTLSTADNDLLVYSNAEHADSDNTAEINIFVHVCLADCDVTEFRSTDSQGNLRCTTECPPSGNSSSFYDPSDGFFIFKNVNTDDKLECLNECPIDKIYHDFTDPAKECLTDCKA